MPSCLFSYPASAMFLGGSHRAAAAGPAAPSAATGQHALFGAHQLAALSAQFVPAPGAQIPGFGPFGFGAPAQPSSSVAPPPPAPSGGVSIFDRLADQIVDGLPPPGPPPAAVVTPDDVLERDFADHYMADISDEHKGAFWEALGLPNAGRVSARQVLAIPFAVAETALAAATIPDPNFAWNSQGPAYIPITPFVLGNLLETIRLAAAHRDQATAPPMAPLGPPPSAAVPPATVTTTSEDPGLTSFRLVVHPSIPGSFSLLSSVELRAWKAQYKRVMDDDPPDEERPSDRQISGLSAYLLSAPGGRRRAPAVCFTVWLPYGNVTYDERAHAPRQYTADGHWIPTRFRGPASYDAWLRSWMVFEAAMLGLGAASPSTLKKYRDGIKLLVNEWPDKWVAIAVADMQLRTYQWDRIREDLLEVHPAHGGIVETDGWDRVIRLSAYDGWTTGYYAKWWERNCWKPLLAKQTGTGHAPPQPAPAGYLRAPSPPTKRQRIEDTPPGVAAGAAPPSREAPVQRRADNQKKCKNCGASGHSWWEGCPVVLKPELQRTLEGKGRGRGTQDASASGGGNSGGGNAGGGGGGKGSGRPNRWSARTNRR